VVTPRPAATRGRYQPPGAPGRSLPVASASRPAGPNGRKRNEEAEARPFQLFRRATRNSAPVVPERSPGTRTVPPAAEQPPRNGKPFRNSGPERTERPEAERGSPTCSALFRPRDPAFRDGPAPRRRNGSGTAGLRGWPSTATRCCDLSCGLLVVWSCWVMRCLMSGRPGWRTCSL